MNEPHRIERRLKLHDLKVVATVARLGSMGKAARRLNTSQPNVSKSIADLEHALGVRLLDRHQQGVQPTEYGRALLDCGMTVFDKLRQGVKTIEFLADPATGNVRIGSITPLAPVSSRPLSIACRAATRALYSISGWRRRMRCTANFMSETLISWSHADSDP